MSFINPYQSLEEIKRDTLHALNRAGHDRNSAFRFITLCTISDNEPNARYVVLRKFDMNTHQLLIYTDYRSHKVIEIQKNPNVSVLAYNQQKRYQIKLIGEASLHYQNAISKQHWDGLEGGHEAYLTKAAPGSQVEGLSEAHLKEGAIEDHHFAVIDISIKKMEVLQLSNEGHIRANFDFNQSIHSFLVP